MELFETILLILLVVVSVSLGALVLIQQSKGADIGAAFGSGAANTLFGSSGATSFVVKFTATLAIGYFLIAFGLAFTAKERADSLKGFDTDSLPSLQQVGDDLMGPEEDQMETVGDDETDLGLPLEGDDLPDFPDSSSDGETNIDDAESSEAGDSTEIPDI
ncbi:MAG: preprotein translocase subunit SecG [Gammaproteobacteria bacterium]|nr:preprotein translocase subunit SecG [Gammaproteobacteria bacterium]